MKKGIKKAEFGWSAFWNREILAPECDELCRFRSCYSPAENKGVFAQGRGYTRYFDSPEPVCGTRHLRGCTHERGARPIPDLKAMLSWAREHPKMQFALLKALAELIQDRERSDF